MNLLLIILVTIIYIIAYTLKGYAIPIGIGLIASLIIYLGYKVYVNIYFKSKKFKLIKESVEKYIKNCNDLNNHIEDLKLVNSDIKAFDYGEAVLVDNSNYKFSRNEWKKLEKNIYVHNCSAVVCKNSKDQPFKYLCKYFDIPIQEESLLVFESLLNNYSAVEQGKELLQKERDSIINDIEKSIPRLIIKYNKKRLIIELGFNPIDLSDLYFPNYKFQYVSAGGNSSLINNIRMDIENLNKFVKYLNGLIKYRKSIEGQRALMTSDLRENIKKRDNYTCRKCGLSINDERNLLLEIDHIIPLSKGGITSEENLQTLCWKCNRSKGAKLIEQK